MSERSVRFALILALVVVTAGAAWGKTVVVQVQARDYQELYDHIAFKGTSIDIAGGQPGATYDLVLDESDLPVIRTSGLEWSMVVPDLEYWRDLTGEFGQYRPYDEHVVIMRNWASLYPNLCILESLGPTYEGRWIYGVKISDEPQVEDPTEVEAIVYSQIHSREWACSEIARHFVDTLLRNYLGNSEFRDFIDNHQLHVFPLTNVDGYVYDYPSQRMWRKNRQPFGSSTGTDLNRNGNGACNGNRFADFGALVRGSRTSNMPSDETFCGARGAWTPENTALTEFYKVHTFAVSVSLHSYSELVLWPYGTGELTPDNTYMINIGTGAAGQINRLSGGTYTPGQTISLYPVNGGVEDWIYGWSHHVGGFPCLPYVFECGTTFYQPTNNLDGMQTQVFKGIWYMVTHSDNIVADLEGAVARPILAPMDTSPDGSFTLHWTPIRPAANHPDKWELEELTGLTVVTDDIEGGTARWTLQGFSQSTTQKHSGTYSLFSGTGNNISNYAATVDPYPVQPGDSLSFWISYNLENNYDVVVAEVSLEGKEWIQLHERYTGNSGGWVRKVFSLAPWAGKSVYIRFHAASDDGTNNAGVFVDDVYPVPTFATHTTVDNNITDTLYAITGKDPGQYWYRVRGHNVAWNWGDKGPLEDVIVTGSGIAAEPAQPVTHLTAVAPNPFSGRTTVSYTLGRPGRVTLNVFDAAGRSVRQLVRRSQAPDAYEVNWDGRDAAGQLLPAGVYVLRLESAGNVFSRTVLLR